MFNTERIDVLTKDQCMVDSTFVLTDPLNVYLREHLDVRDRYIIYASFLMDLMILTFMAIFYLYWKTFRIIFAYLLFFGLRTFV